MCELYFEGHGTKIGRLFNFNVQFTILGFPHLTGMVLESSNFPWRRNASGQLIHEALCFSVKKTII